MPHDLGQGLNQSGLVRPGESPAPAMRQLTSDLHTQLGTQVPPGLEAGTASLPELSANLRQAITSLQERTGLPQTGNLDRDTLGELARRGLVNAERVPATSTENAQKAPPPVRTAKDVYDRQPEQDAAARGRREPTNVEGLRSREPRPAREVKVARAGLDAATAREAQQTQQTRQAQQAQQAQHTQQAQQDKDVKLSLAAGLLRRELGAGSLTGGGSSGAAPGEAEHAAEAAARSSVAGSSSQGAPADPATRRAPPPREIVPEQAPPRTETTRLERVVPRRGLDNTSASTAHSERRSPVESTPRADVQARPAPSAPATRAPLNTAAPMAASTTAASTEQARSAATLGTQDPSGRGIADPRASSPAAQGVGETPGEGAGRTDQLGLALASTVRESSGSDGAGAHEEPDATERDTGNSKSGDERFGDEERGHASGDDGTEEGPGYYRIADLSEQIDEALYTIVREPGQANQATSYCWDVTLFRPGVYGPGQPAPVIFHLVVDTADAFDPVWQRARAELARHLERLQPDHEPPSEEDFMNALRRARVADAAELEERRSAFDGSPTEPIPITDKIQR
ncbi:MAG: hypothetical protein ABIJ09_10055 [Pseudomonadota bacterium]